MHRFIPPHRSDENVSPAWDTNRTMSLTELGIVSDTEIDFYLHLRYFSVCSSSSHFHQTDKPSTKLRLLKHIRKRLSSSFGKLCKFGLFIVGSHLSAYFLASAKDNAVPQTDVSCPNLCYVYLRAYGLQCAIGIFSFNRFSYLNVTGYKI